MRKTYNSSLDGIYKRKMILVSVTDEHPNHKKGEIRFACYYTNNMNDAGRVGGFEHLPKDIKYKIALDFNKSL